MSFSTLQLAREAVDNSNYDLANEIYDRLLKESKPSISILVGKGECCAKAGRLSEALDAYAQACRLGEVRPEELESLVDSLVDKLCTKDGSSSVVVQEHLHEPLDMFTCIFCYGIIYEPATLSCGHAFCRVCFEQDSTKRCKLCNERQEQVKSDVLLSGQFKKYFADTYKAAKLRTEGFLMYNEGKYAEAMTLYTEAAEFAPSDHLITSNKSLVFIAQEKVSEGISEANWTCELQPRWPMGYFRKGSALMAARRYEEALTCLLQCLSLDSTATSARVTLAKVLQKMLSPLATENLKHTEIQSLGGTTKIANPISIFSTGWDNLASAISRGFDKFEGKRRIGKKTKSSNASASSNDIASKTICSKQSPVLRIETNKFEEVCSTSLQDEKSVDSSYGQKKRKHYQQNGSPPPSPDNKYMHTDIEQALRIIPEDLLDRSDYECCLCLRLFYEPTTTPCGHTFCAGCLNRCLDHKPECPLCKDPLMEFLANKKLKVNILVKNILMEYFERQFQERSEVHAKEMQELRGFGDDPNCAVIPVFICTMAFPSVVCPLYIFEPRYKLMIRQCMECGTKQFGMCVPSEENSFSDIGCMLKVLEVETLPNGRSAIRTVGSRRFKVISRNMRDGYNTAYVRFLKDEPIQDSEFKRIKELHGSVYAEAFAWFNAQDEGFHLKVIQYYGAMPALPEDLQESPNGPDWIWWILVILPVSQRAQLHCMALTTIKERLLFLQTCLHGAYTIS
ncbi:LON peptidase N-terminal domain and RING finger protein 1-like [Antedon mediterranea]|uniref:LON peptidase N-terminal domain and RING finger protein 1-like n=1 Tax=Antedon mediterranea TaxID=105859 RepID=UPI003AF9BA1F